MVRSPCGTFPSLTKFSSPFRETYDISNKMIAIQCAIPLKRGDDWFYIRFFKFLEPMHQIMMIKKPHFQSSLALLTVILMYVAVSFVREISAQNSTQWALPEGARVRLAKGWITQIAYSPDGTRLAAAGSLGIWIYDVNTGTEERSLRGTLVACLRSHFHPTERYLPAVVGTKPFDCGMYIRGKNCTRSPGMMPESLRYRFRAMDPCLPAAVVIRRFVSGMRSPASTCGR